MYVGRRLKHKETSDRVSVPSKDYKRQLTKSEHACKDIATNGDAHQGRLTTKVALFLKSHKELLLDHTKLKHKE